MSTTPTRAKRRRQVRIASKPKVPLPPQLQRVNLNAAGVDIGSEEHWAAVPPGRDREGQDVRRFGAFSGDLCALADWLQRCEIETVAMESTGVYWIALYELLVERGFEVLLVDARRVRNVPGRKTDVLDCQWLQELHTYGLLRGAFRPADQVCVLRSYLRQRSMLVAYASHHIQHMQKALEQMNLKLAHVVSDITGVTGMGIIKAILGGERDPVKLAKLRDPRCKSSEATVARALEGHYREEHLFALQQALELVEFYQGLIGSELLEDQLQIVGQALSVDDLIFFVDQHRDIVVGVQVNGTKQFHLRLLLYEKVLGLAHRQPYCLSEKPSSVVSLN